MHRTPELRHISPPLAALLPIIALLGAANLRGDVAVPTGAPSRGGVDLGAGLRPECADPASDLYYFPRRVLGVVMPHFDEDEFRRQWYSKHLRATGEPSLSCAAAVEERYRFLWLPTWGHPIAVRLAHTGERASLIAVELDGAGGYEPGKVARRASRSLTKEEWDAVQKALDRATFWKLPSHERSGGTDGSQLIVEGRIDRAYHAVDRWSPREGAYRDLCMLFLRLSGLVPEANRPGGIGF
jgi:hypothetical protein